MSEKKRNITIGEIARLAGVSRSSASAVLNGKPSVREETRQKVLDCIQREDFQPGLVAKSMVRELANTMTVLAADPGSPFDMMVFQGIAAVLRSEGYNILFHVVEPEDADNPDAFAGLEVSRSAGYIVLGINGGEQGKHARRWIEEGIPLVVVGLAADLKTHMVTPDYRSVMRTAADYAIRRGHRRLGHLGASPLSLGEREYELGLIEAMVEHGIPLSMATIVKLGLSADEERAAAVELLRNPETRPSIVLCFNEMLAINVYQAARELSLKIPDDVSVVGIGGTYLSELLGPPMTMMDIFPRELGERSARLLLRVLRKQTGRRLITETIKPRLRVGGSVLSLNG